MWIIARSRLESTSWQRNLTGLVPSSGWIVNYTPVDRDTKCRTADGATMRMHGSPAPWSSSLEYASAHYVWSSPVHLGGRSEGQSDHVFNGVCIAVLLASSRYHTARSGHFQKRASIWRALHGISTLRRRKNCTCAGLVRRLAIDRRPARIY